MGADFIDYIIADKVVLPFEHQPFYTEKIVHLPDCYQVNDTNGTSPSGRQRDRKPGFRRKAVCSAASITTGRSRPRCSIVWMRLLHAVEGSVLWLLRDNATAEQNLRKEAAARGVGPGRLVFAPRMKLEDHLARHRLADLFLDTLPYNAHTTASDALWIGLPVVTRLGKSFAGRVAASLLNAIGLPELVTTASRTTRRWRCGWRRIAARLRGIKAKLARNRDTLIRFSTTPPISLRYSRRLTPRCGKSGKRERNPPALLSRANRRG